MSLPKSTNRHGLHIEQFLNRLISGGIDVADIQDIMRQAEGACRRRRFFID